jgi:hypothetical protein
VAIINKARRTFVINLRLRVVNLKYSGRQRYKGARLSDVELRGMPSRGG